MEEMCADCEWREHFYWNFMETWSFHVILGADSSQLLKMPRKFVERKKLPDTVSLMGPNRIACFVGLRRASGEVFFDNGWEEFVRENYLEQGDALVFKCYKGTSHLDVPSHFDVLVFEKSSSCEKMASLFARKRRGSGSETNGGVNPAEPSPCNGSCIRPKEPAADSRHQPVEVQDTRRGSDHTPVKETVGQTSKQKRGRERAEKKANHAGSSSHGGNPHKSTPPIPCNIEKTRKCSRRKAHQNGPVKDMLKRYGFLFQSNRRDVTEEEKARALELAHSARVRNPSFVAVMVPTNVTYKFFMIIPVAFVKSELRRMTGQTFTLSNRSGKNWTVCYSVSRISGLCGAGWTTFVWDNNLEVGDALVFELNHERRQFEVQIFRVVQQTVPVIRLNKDDSRGSAAVRGRGRPKSSFSHRRRRRSRSSTPPPNRESSQGASKKRKITRSSVSENPRESEGESEDDAYVGGESDDDEYVAYPFFYKSKRRRITEEEEQRALDAAMTVQPANPYFLLTMQKSQVTARFYLNVPIQFLKNNGDAFVNQWQQVFLRVRGGRTYSVWYKPRRPGRGGGIEKGWSDFVLENNLEPGDVLVFELCTGEEKTTFDVQIFRVVAQVVPLIKIWRHDIMEKRRRITKAERTTYSTEGTEKSQQKIELITPKSEDESSS